MKLVAIKSYRPGTDTVHMGEDRGWSSVPFCPALRNQRRMIAIASESEGEVNCRACIKEAHARFLDFEPLVRISSRVRNLIMAVRVHATANYNVGAWDIIVVAYTDSELAELVRRCRTAKGAIAKVAEVVELYRERRAPHDAEIAAATGCTAYAECAECLSGKVCVDRCTHCGGTNSSPCPSHDLEPDGSIVTARHAHDGELVSLTRTWPGKVGSSSILVEWYGDGNAPESYTPGWRGVTIDSNFCDYDASVPF